MSITPPDALSVGTANANALRERDEALAAMAIGMRAPLSSMLVTSALLLQHTNTEAGAAHLRRYVESLQRSADQLDMVLRALIERVAPSSHLEATSPSWRPAPESHVPAVVNARPGGARTPTPSSSPPPIPSARARNQRALRHRVLVIDDDVETLAGMRDALERNGFEVVTATTGVTALGLIETSAPDLIVLDLCMPGMDGEQICRELRRKPGRAAPIVVVSASPRIEPVCRSLGLQHYLRKPFEVSELVAKLSGARDGELPPTHAGTERRAEE